MQAPAASFRRNRNRNRNRNRLMIGLAATLIVAACASSDPGDADISGGVATDPDPLDSIPDDSDSSSDTTTTTTLLITREDVADDPTNVVVVMTDDQTVEQMRWLPTVAAHMEEQGVEFANSWTNYPLCGPSRVTFLTGLHATNHGLECNTGLAADFRAVQKNSLGPWLQEAGVHTIHVGKYLNGYGGRPATRYVPDGWNDWRALAGDASYRYLDFDMVLNGEFVEYGPDGTDYSTDVLAEHFDEAVRAAPADESFFAVFAPLAPHFEGGQTFATPAERHEDLVDDVLRTPNFDSCTERDVCPPEGSPLANPPLSDEDIAALDDGYQTASEALFAVDEAFEQIITTLTELSELDNTVIVFTSDNGFFYGEHGIAKGKILPGREVLTVPLYVSGPGFDEPRTETAPVSNVDLAPTIVDIFGATPGFDMDGRSLLEPLDPDRALLIQGLKSTVGGYHGVFAGGWLFYDHAELDRNELYAPDDEFQLVTLDDDPEFDDVEASLSELTETLKACSGAACAVSWTADDAADDADDGADEGEGDGEGDGDVEPGDDGGEVGTPGEIVVAGPGPTVTAQLSGPTAEVSVEPVEGAQDYRYRTIEGESAPSEWTRLALETRFTLTGLDPDVVTAVEVSVRRDGRWRRSTIVILSADAVQSTEG